MQNSPSNMRTCACDNVKSFKPARLNVWRQSTADCSGLGMDAALICVLCSRALNTSHTKTSHTAPARYACHSLLAWEGIDH